MDYKQMSKQELAEYFLKNRHDKIALAELRNKKSDITITIAADAPPGTFEKVLKKLI